MKRTIIFGSVHKILILILSCCFLLTGCSDNTGKKVTTDSPVPEPVALLGLEKQELLDSLKLSDKQLAENSDLAVVPSEGGYLYGEPCAVRFTLDKGIVYACRYDVSTEGKTAEQTFDMLKGFAEKLTAAYGEPKTYPGFSQTVAGIESADQLADAVERWLVPGEWEYPGLAPEETFVQAELRYSSAGSISVNFSFIRHVLSAYELENGIAL